VRQHNSTFGDILFEGALGQRKLFITMQKLRKQGKLDLSVIMGIDIGFEKLKKIIGGT
jgi:hypothetical protein